MSYLLLWSLAGFAFAAGSIAEHFRLKEAFRNAQARAEAQAEEVRAQLAEARHFARIVRIVTTARGASEYHRN